MSDVIDHKSKFLEAHLKKLEEGQFNDIRIVCKDGVVEANKFMLSVQNDYFKAMFDSPNFKEGATGEVKIECSTKTMMEAIVKYLYNGTFEFKAFKFLEILDVINLANMMMLEHLKEDAIKYFKQQDENINLTLQAIEIADEYRLEDIVDHLFKDMNRCLPRIDFDFIEMSPKNMKRLIFGFESAPQIVKFKAFVAWYKDVVNQEKLGNEMKKEIMQSFDTSKFTTKEILEDVRKSKLYSDDMVIDMIGNNYFKLEDKVETNNRALERELESVKLRLTKLEGSRFRTY